jgi:hypothetical protein
MDTLPSLLWPIIIIVALVVFYKPLRDRIPFLTSVKGPGGLEARFAEQLAEAQPPGSKAPERDRIGAVARARREQNICKGKKILWVDDQPGNNRQLMATFRELLEVSFHQATTTEEALEVLIHNDDYSMVITDMERPESPTAGLDLINRMVGAGIHIRTVIYLWAFNPGLGTPPYTFGITNRPDELLHYIIDICEREAGTAP